MQESADVVCTSACARRDFESSGEGLRLWTGQSAPSPHHYITTHLLYCTVRVSTLPWAVPPAAVAAAVICEVPSGVAATRFTNPVPGDCANEDVAVTETVGGLGTAGGEL